MIKPDHVSWLKQFQEVRNEVEFKDSFKLIAFAIIDDHNSWKDHNPQGNLLPFVSEFL